MKVADHSRKIYEDPRSTFYAIEDVKTHLVQYLEWYRMRQFVASKDLNSKELFMLDVCEEYKQTLERTAKAFFQGV